MVNNVNDDYLKLSVYYYITYGHDENKIIRLRYLYLECYQKNDNYIHVHHGKRQKFSNCLQDGLHETDASNGLETIANFLLRISKGEDEYIKNLIFNRVSNVIVDYILSTSNKLITQNQKENEEKNNEIKFPNTIHEYYELPSILTSLGQKPKLISSLHQFLKICHIMGHTERHERNKKKYRMDNIIPSQRLVKNKNIWNLTIIDNIDFKTKSFTFELGNNSNSDNAILDIAMMYKLDLELGDDNYLDIVTDQALFGRLIKCKEKWSKLRCYCNIAMMYKLDLELGDDNYLDIVTDQALFGRLIKCKEKWSKLRCYCSNIVVDIS
ncbi:hypothetical protein Glove_20g22 [Diversispora epigaea]|uniref:Uncharacterized protein n=1 Tax=Diversispora epigaea TaxID=1348612 RepID=A0A397JMM6_9GLOM|nr:hypothetical protein Glove_20g22 [Diversispora epigaea]